MIEKSKRNIIVVGATSAIAKAMLLVAAGRLGKVGLCARNVDSLAVLAEDLRARFPSLTVKCWQADIMELATAPNVWKEMEEFCGIVDEVLFTPGELGQQIEMEREPELAFKLIALNSAASTAWILWAAGVLERHRGAVLAVITSVAGVRGRVSNYIYGSSKAQLSVLLEGLRVRLAKSGVKVVDFRPGIVDTPMTAGLKKSFLTASAEAVGLDLARAMENGEGVRYSPSFWKYIMFVIRHLPYFIFKKTRF